jgi:predicted phosphodiesterase
MRYLILGDIHGNIVALKKVLDEFACEVDEIICHGDVVNYGPWSNECVELLDEKKVICLIGNHEYAFLNGSYDGNNELVKEFFNKTYSKFKRFDLIKAYQFSYENNYFKVVHTINKKYYYPNSDLSDVVLSTNTIIGHSHHAFIRKTNSNFLLINTGSVGQNRSNLNEIDFCIFDSKWVEYKMMRINYDAKIIVNQMVADNYPIGCIKYYESKLV